MFGLDARQWLTLAWGGLAVVLSSFAGSVLILALPAVANDYHASVPDLSNLGSVLTLGTLGALPLSTLADHFGRRRLLALGVAGFSVANFATAFAPSLAALAVLRMAAVCFEVLVGGVATALIVEEAPPGRRGQAVSVLAILGGAGLLIAIIVYPLVTPHWRWLFAAGGAGVLAAPLIWSRLPESRAWQRAHVTGSAIRLLLRPPWRRRIAIVMAVGCLGAVLGRPAGLLFTLFASQTLKLSPVAISALIFASGVAAVVSYIPGGFLSDRFGRRIPGVLLGVATVISTSASFASGTAGFIAGNILWSAFASAATPVMGAWSAELYPTRARATAEAAGALAGAAGGIAGLQLVGLASHALGLGRAIGLAGAAALAGVLLLLLLPETRGKPLPD
jgi:MFS family permease